jgi:hypothetical protein
LHSLQAGYSNGFAWISSVIEELFRLPKQVKIFTSSISDDLEKQGQRISG